MHFLRVASWQQLDGKRNWNLSPVYDYSKGIERTDCNLQCFQVEEETNMIQLNAVNLEILEVTYEQNEKDVKRAEKAVSTVIDKESQILSLIFETPLTVGLASVNILYTGKVAETKKGFFKSKYTSKEGDERYAFATHFEPDMARQCIFRYLLHLHSIFNNTNL